MAIYSESLRLSGGRMEESEIINRKDRVVEEPREQNEGEGSINLRKLRGKDSSNRRWMGMVLHGKKKKERRCGRCTKPNTNHPS